MVLLVNQLMTRPNIIKTIIAFANTAGGTLILGVRDGDKALVGIDNPIKEVEKMANLINDCISPKIAPNIDVVSYNLHMRKLEEVF